MSTSWWNNDEVCGDTHMLVCTVSNANSQEDCRELVGLNLRVGRAVYGGCHQIEDKLQDCKSTLLTGQAGVGKSTILRERSLVILWLTGSRFVDADVHVKNGSLKFSNWLAKFLVARSKAKARKAIVPNLGHHC